VIKKYKNKKFHVSQLSTRVPTCWITKGWRKTTWVKFSTSAAANTNQIVIEDVWQVVIKVIKSVKSTPGEISIKTITKNRGEKHAYVQEVGWATIEVDRRENTECDKNIKRRSNRMWQAYKTKINRKSGKIAGLFYIFCQMNKAKKISIFPEC